MTVMNVPSLSPSASIRSRWAWVSSTGESALRRSMSPMSEMLWKWMSSLLIAVLFALYRREYRRGLRSSQSLVVDALEICQH